MGTVGLDRDAQDLSGTIARRERSPKLDLRYRRLKTEVWRGVLSRSVIVIPAIGVIPAIAREFWGISFARFCGV